MKREVWVALLQWAKERDSRNVSNEACTWVAHGIVAKPQPTDAVEWRNAIEEAFDAGRKYERLLRHQD